MGQVCWKIYKFGIILYTEDMIEYINDTKNRNFIMKVNYEVTVIYQRKVI